VVEGFTVAGDGGYTNCQIMSDDAPQGQLTGRIQVQAGVPALYADICDPVSGAAPDPGKVSVTVTAPDGTTYNQDSNTSSQFVKTSGGKLYAMCVLQPAPGVWTINCSSGAAVAFRANLQTVPASDPLGSAMRALTPHYPGERTGAGDTVAYEEFVWAFWPAAVLLRAASATAGLALNLSAFVQQLLGVDATEAQKIATLIQPQTVDGVVTTLAQETGNTTSLVQKEVLQNGDGSAGLTGWTIIANGGTGWAVQSGNSDRIGYPNNFAVSNAWCKKSQQIDLLQAGGLNAQYADSAPPITVTDWVTALYPPGATQQSQYYFIARLLDANQTTLKEFRTGTLNVAAAAVEENQLTWTRFNCSFGNYGAGARYVYFEHGGLNPQAWDSQYGVKMSGAAVEVQLAPPQPAAEQLLQNGSAAGGLTGWTDNSPTAGAWATESGPGVACPESTGDKDFAVAAGPGRKYQVIDLVAAGYTAAQLDGSPLVEVGQWVASSSHSATSYSMKVELRDQNQQPLSSYDSGAVQVPLLSDPPVGFRRMNYNFSGYAAGLRYIYFEHGASTTTPVTGQAPAKITGAFVQLPAPGGATATAQSSAAPRSLAVTPTPIPDTNVIPYRWVCRLGIIYGNNLGPYTGTGWLISKSGNNSIVVTAAHNVYNYQYGWARRIEISPAYNEGVVGHYTPRTIGLGSTRLPIDFLLKVQAQTNTNVGYDYAVLLVDATDWDAGGFELTVSQDNQLQNQHGSIAGYPGESPYTPRKMYKEDVTLNPQYATLVSVPTNFTGGASGSPVYVRGTRRAVGVYSFGEELMPPLNWIFGLRNFWGAYATRVTDQVARDVERWRTPLSPDDRVCSLQMVIHTGDQIGSGTDDPASCTIDGHTYELNAYWMPESGERSTQNTRNHFDGYDLTSGLRSNYPGGIFLRDLLGKNYEIRIISANTWFSQVWEVQSVTVMVNGQMLSSEVFNQWITFGGRTDVLTGTFRLG
jgi:V8-like Glu-specific endopeptidase